MKVEFIAIVGYHMPIKNINGERFYFFDGKKIGRIIFCEEYGYGLEIKTHGQPTRYLYLSLIFEEIYGKHQIIEVLNLLASLSDNNN